MTHRELCVSVAQWVKTLSWCDLVGWELRYGRGVADVLALGTKQGKVAVLEVKRTRADLLQDLKAKKMLKYENGSTYCYLAAPREVFKKDPIEELTALGLPTHWGIYIIGEQCIRSPRLIKQQPKPRIYSLTRKIARSHMWRQLDTTQVSIDDSEE